LCAAELPCLLIMTSRMCAFFRASTTRLTEKIVLLNQVIEHQTGIPKSSSIRLRSSQFKNKYFR
jgi:hypothetical protein